MEQGAFSREGPQPPCQTAHLFKITAGSRSAEPPETGFFRPSGAGPPLRVTGAGRTISDDADDDDAFGAETLAFSDRAFDVGTFVGQRLTNAVGNADNAEDDLAAAVRAYVAGTDGRVAVVDNDTLLLVPTHAPTKVDAKAIARALAALSFEEESTPEVTRRVLAEAGAGRPSFFWWD